LRGTLEGTDIVGKKEKGLDHQVSKCPCWTYLFSVDIGRGRALSDSTGALVVLLQVHGKANRASGTQLADSRLPNQAAVGRDRAKPEAITDRVVVFIALLAEDPFL
jgi:hypothetical protein